MGHRLTPGSAAQRFTISNRVLLNRLSKPEGCSSRRVRRRLHIRARPPARRAVGCCRCSERSWRDPGPIEVAFADVEDNLDRNEGEHDPPDDALMGCYQVWRHGATRLSLVVAGGTRRRAAELGRAGSAQCGRTVWIAIRIAVVRMQEDWRRSIPIDGMGSDVTNWLSKCARAGERESRCQ